MVRSIVHGMCVVAIVAACVMPPAAPAGGPEDTIKQGTEKILETLRNPDLKAPEKRDERRQKMKDAVDSVFNWDEMAKRSLARHWRKRSAEERKTFVPLFADMVRNTYMSKLEGFSGEKVKYAGERVKGDYARVAIAIITKKETEIPVEYSMKKFDGQWLVYDVAVEGVRMVNNYRTQFNTMLNRMSYDKFIDKLRTKVANMAKEPDASDKE